MFIILKRPVLLVFLLSTMLQHLAAQEINIDAVNAYWKMTGPLKQGDTISRESWKSFLDLEGNKRYIANQGFDDRFMEAYRKTIQFVYNPANDGKVKKMMDDKINHWMVYKVNQYKVHEAELKAYVARLKEPAYLDSMYKQSWAWLPKALQGRSPSTKIYFIALDNDALVDNGTIVFTVWSAYNQDKLKLGILGGHELHHILRKPIGFETSNKADEGILYLLNNVLNEGSADMVDKSFSFDQTKDIAFEYHFDELLLSHPDLIIRQLDSTIQITANSHGQQFTTVKAYRNLINYSSGHNPGYYMADIIVRNGYKNAMVEHVQDPFYFVYLYNRAARKDSKHPPLFAEVAIKYIKTLEKTAKRDPK